MYDKIKRWHDAGLWSDVMVQNAVKKGVLTQEQADEIIGGEDNADSGEAGSVAVLER